MNRYLFRSYVKVNELNNCEPGLAQLHDFQASAEAGGLPSLGHLSDARFFQFAPVDKNPELTFINLEGLLSLLRGSFTRQRGVDRPDARRARPPLRALLSRPARPQGRRRAERDEYGTAD